MKKLFTIISFATCFAIISCNGKKYNNHVMNDSMDSASLSAGKTTRDSGTRMDAASPANTDSTGEQTGRMNNTMRNDTMNNKTK